LAIVHLEPVPPKQRRRALEGSLRAAIRSGRLAAGTRLPSTRALAGDLGLARTTVLEAYQQLEIEGYLRARRGAGTWVAELGVGARPRAVAAAEAPSSPRFSFNPGLPDLTAFPHNAWAKGLLEGLRSLPHTSLGYGDPRGHPELRAALADYLSRARAVVADPDLVIVCAGFSHSLSLVARVLHARGARTMAMEDPCLAWHRDIVTRAGFDVAPLEVDGQGANTEVLADVHANAVVLAPAHQFPLGCVLSPRRRAAAIAWARATGGLVIEDDYDAELRYDREPVGALQQLDPDHVVFAGTLSKTLAPGLRLGWVVVPEPLVEPIVRVRRAEDVHVPVTEQIAFARLLASGGFERHLRRLRRRYRRRRERVLEMLAQRAPAATAIGVSAGLRVLLRLPRPGPSAASLVRRGAERSLGLFPVGPCYHAGQSPDGGDGVVLGYAALPEHDFEPGLRSLGDLLADSLPPEQSRLPRPSSTA
jgi:GntR family transcriptional regulator/MocR family aminotransferase